MKHLKSYKLFESYKGESIFPHPDDIRELLYDLSDDDTITDSKFISSGYLIYPQYSILHTSDRELRSAISYVMTTNPDDWQNKKCEVIIDETYGSIFLDPKNMTVKELKDCQEEIDLKEVEESAQLAFNNKLPNKPTLQLFLENIESGKIPAIPFMFFNCGNFKYQDKQKVIECLQRIYKATGFRPYKEFWLEDYIDENDPNDLMTLCGFIPTFVKVDDATYKKLIESNPFGPITNSATREITSHLI